MQEYLVTVIVSVYKSERFMRGLLADLEAQTIADKLEIVIVDSHSPQNERAIVEEFQQKYDNIVYFRHHERESSHATWNRCMQAARGKYVTLACTDDRHKPDALERMVEVLEARPDIALVYANVYITRTENETFEKNSHTGTYRWLDFDPLKLLYCCFMGPQPMWRSNLREKYGMMDGALETAGDWEFWLRMAETETCLHLDEVLGLYLYSPTSSEHRDPALTSQENEDVQQRYAHRISEMRAREARANAAKIENLKMTPDDLKPPPGDPGSAIPVLPKNLQHRRITDFQYEELVLAIRDQESNAQMQTCFDWLRRTTTLNNGRRLRLVKAHPGIREFRFDLNVSPKTLDLQTALHRAINWECEYVVLLTPDAQPAANWLDHLVQIAKSDPQIAVVGPVTNEATDIQKVESVPENAWQNWAENLPETKKNQWQEVPFLANFCLLLKTDAIRKAGGLIENYPTSTNLKDLFSRLKNKGYKLVLANGVYVHRSLYQRDTEEIEAEDTAIDQLLEHLLESGQAALQKQDFNTARAEFLKIIQQYPDNSTGYAALGVTYMLQNKFADAIPQLEKAIELAPDVIDLYNQLGVAYFQTSDKQKAESVFIEANQRAPKDVQTMLNLAELYRSQEMYTEATAYLKQAVKLAPRNPDVLSLFGEVSYELGDTEAARLAMKRLKKTDRRHPGYKALRKMLAENE